MASWQYCWWCKKEWREATSETRWCPKCCHELGRPPAQCQCLMCEGGIGFDPNADILTHTTPELLPNVDVEKWLKWVSEYYAELPADVYVLMCCIEVFAAAARELAVIALLDRPTIERTYATWDALAEAYEALTNVVEV